MTTGGGASTWAGGNGIGFLSSCNQTETPPTPAIPSKASFQIGNLAVFTEFSAGLLFGASDFSGSTLTFSASTCLSAKRSITETNVGRKAGSSSMQSHNNSRKRSGTSFSRQKAGSLPEHKRIIVLPKVNTSLFSEGFPKRKSPRCSGGE